MYIHNIWPTYSTPTKYTASVSHKHIKFGFIVASSASTLPLPSVPQLRIFLPSFKNDKGFISFVCVTTVVLFIFIFFYTLSYKLPT